MVGQLILSVLLLFQVRRRNVFRTGVLVLLVSGLLSNCFLISIGWIVGVSLSLHSIWIWLCLIMIVWLVPNDIYIWQLSKHLSAKYGFKLFSRLFAVLASISTLFFLQGLVIILSGSSLGELRLNHQTSEGQTEMIEVILGTISYGFIICIYLFWNAHILGYAIWDKVLFFIGSMSYPLWVLNSFGRDGVLAYIYFMVVCFVFARKHNDKLRVGKTLILIVGAALYYFIAMSISRFTNDSLYGNVWISALDYIGQQYTNLHVYIKSDMAHYYGRFNFSFFTGLFLEDADAVVQEAKENLAKDTKAFWYFGYALKELWIDFGFLGTVLFLLLVRLVRYFLRLYGFVLGEFIYLFGVLLFTFLGCSTINFISLQRRLL